MLVFWQIQQSGVIPLEVFLENTSSNATNIDWFANGDPFGTTLPNLILDQEGNYLIQLVGRNTDISCSDTALTTIFVSLIVNLPNVFTPNNVGVNDTYCIQSYQAIQLEFNITNRWGNVVKMQNLNVVEGIPTLL